MHDRLTPLIAHARQLPEVWQATHAAISSARRSDGSCVDLTAPIPDTVGSINEIGLRLVAIAAQVSSIGPISPENAITAPVEPLAKFDEFALLVINRLHTLKDQIDLGAAAGFSALENPLRLEAPGIGLIQIDNEISYIDHVLDDMADRLSRFLPLLKFNERIDLGGLIGAVAAAMAEIAALKDRAAAAGAAALRGAAELSEAIEARAAEASAAAQAASEMRDATAQHEAQALASRDGAIAYNDNARTQVEAITAISGKANELNAVVVAYEPQFEEFKRKLDERTALFNEGQAQFTSLTQRLKDLAGELTSMKDEAGAAIAAAKKALGWTSEAELARSFTEAATEQDTKLVVAQRLFYASVVAMAVSAYVALGGWEQVKLPDFKMGETTDAWVALINLLSAAAARLMVLLPAWFALNFTHARYKTLMRLKEAYLFKKTIAAAIPGFRETAADPNAPEPSKAITLAAFDRLLVNPQASATEDDMNWVRRTPHETALAALNATVEGATKIIDKASAAKKAG